MKSYRTNCAHILEEINHAFQILHQLEEKYNLVGTKTEELHSACEALGKLRKKKQKTLIKKNMKIQNKN